MKPRKGESFQDDHNRRVAAIQPCIFCGGAGAFDRYRKWVCITCARAIWQSFNGVREHMIQVAKTAGGGVSER